jgi:hypothetical protein
MSSLEVRDHRRRLNGTRVDLQLRGRVSAPRNSLSRCKDLQPAALFWLSQNLDGWGYQAFTSLTRKPEEAWLMSVNGDVSPIECITVLSRCQ